MAGSPPYKIFSADGEYVGCVKYLEDAAMLVSSKGSGSCVKYGHRHVIWSEGRESQSAGHSYDYAANVMAARLSDLNKKSFSRAYGT